VPSQTGSEPELIHADSASVHSNEDNAHHDRIGESWVMDVETAEEGHGDSATMA